MYDPINSQLYVFSREGLRTVDNFATNKYGIPSIVLMENAARSAVNIITESIDRDLRSNIVIVCGPGNNGGDGYAIARHLVNNGCGVNILKLDEPKTSDSTTNAAISLKMGIQISKWSPELLGKPSLIIDSIFGTGLDRSLEGPYSGAIETINSCSTDCIAIDIPSGLDCDTGKPHGCSIEAAMTVSFVGMKQGFLNDIAKTYVGEVVIADIGCPNELLEKYALTSTEYDV
ncbi:MAG: NAD(P)H-hydrate epimerase [Phycisphaerales bacterium]|jgi:NAD(P)H-hydrate epimerase|nr:NAD(P)H-hydrate epimerase [Phycisphaerales bacterium]